MNPTEPTRPRGAACPFFDQDVESGGADAAECLAASPSLSITPEYAAAYCTRERHAECALYATARTAAQRGDSLVRDVGVMLPVVAGPIEAERLAATLRPRPLDPEEDDRRRAAPPPPPARRRGFDWAAALFGASLGMLLVVGGVIAASFFGPERTPQVAGLTSVLAITPIPFDAAGTATARIANAAPTPDPTLQATLPPVTAVVAETGATATATPTTPAAATALPTAVSTPGTEGTPGAEATPDPDFPLTLYVNTPERSQLRLRAEAGTEAEIIARIPFGAQVRASPEPVVDGDGNEWYNITYEGQSGYASAQFLRREAPSS